MTDLPRRTAAESLGTAILLATVIGSGIMGERLAGGNVAIALLANTLATGAILVTLILTFGTISGAHFNPAVTMAEAWQGGLAWRTASTSFANPAVTLAREASDTFAGIRPTDAPSFIIAQLCGALAATLLFRSLIPKTLLAGQETNE
jgi:glycerol uptake facilitator-like aquaporin